MGIGIPDEVDRRAQDHGKADGHHHGCKNRLAQHRPHDDALDDEAKYDGGEDRTECDDKDIAADGGRNGPGDIGDDHGHLALREIDQAGRLVNHRKSHRDQAINGADSKA